MSSSSSSSPLEDTFQLHLQTKTKTKTKTKNKNKTTQKSNQMNQVIQPEVLFISSDSNQPYPERSLKPLPAGQPILIGRAAASDKDSKSSQPSPENAKFVCSVMSKTHAQLSWINNQPYLQDTGSTHGTWHKPAERVFVADTKGRIRSRNLTSPSWKKIPNPFPLQDGMSIRFGRAITNPVNGSRHTPLEIVIRIPKLSNLSQPGTYGLDGSHINASDDSDAEELGTQQDQSELKIGHDSVDSHIPTITSAKETVLDHHALPNRSNQSGISSTTLQPRSDPIKSILNDHSAGPLPDAQKQPKRAILNHLSSNSAVSVDQCPSQPPKNSGYPSHSHNSALPPPYEFTRQHDLPQPNPAGNPARLFKSTEISHPPGEHHSVDNSSVSRERQEKHSNIPQGDCKHIEGEKSDVQSDVSKIFGEEKETSNISQNGINVSGEHDGMEEDSEEEASDVEEEATNAIEEKHSHAQDDEEDSVDEGDSRVLDDQQEASLSENIQQPSKVVNQICEENLSMDENQDSSESSAPTSTEGVGSRSRTTTSEEMRVIGKAGNQISTRSSYKDLSVVTTITSKTEFTESLNRLPENLERTVQSPKLYRPAHSEPEIQYQSAQIPSIENSPAFGPDSSIVIKDGPVITPQLKRKRSILIEEENEDEGEQSGMGSSMASESDEGAEEDIEGKKLKKRVKLTNDNEKIICAHCSNEMPDPKKGKFETRVLSAAKSIAIFALGGVATVAGILAFENILDE